MSKRHAVAMVALGTAFFTAASAAAQPTCGARAEVLGWLAASYQEAPVAAGVSVAGDLVEVVASADGATWTILVTSPRGRTCMLGAGEGWRILVPPREEPAA